MNRKSVPGSRMFLYTVTDLISQGKSVTCTEMEHLITNGVASKLYGLYASDFDENGFNADNVNEIDEYCKRWSGIAEGQEMRKYGCKEAEGLSLLIKLFINEIT